MSWLGARRIDLPEVASTNDEAQALARGGAAHGTIVLARAQTSGRGRQGRAWCSPSGDNVYLSAILRLGLAPAALPPLTLAVGLGVRDAVAALGVPAASVKWPNDVGVWRDGGTFVKLAGVLTETTTRAGAIDAVIVGLGLNVGDVDLPGEIATSIARERGAPVGRDEAIAALLPALERWIDRFRDGGAGAIAAAFRRDAGFLGRAVSVRDGASHRDGRAVDVDDGGALVLEVDGLRHRVVAGEVTAAAPEAR